MQKIIFSVLALALATPVLSNKAYAGAAPASLRCESKSFVFEGVIPADVEEFEVVLKHKKQNKTVTWNNETLELFFGVLEDSILAFETKYEAKNSPFLRFWAVPKSFGKIKRRKHGFRVTFLGRISSEGTGRSKPVTMKCVYDYSI